MTAPVPETLRLFGPTWSPCDPWSVVNLEIVIHPKATRGLVDLLLRSSLGERPVVDGVTVIRPWAVAVELIRDREARASVLHIPRYKEGRLLRAGKTHRRGARERRQGELPIGPEIAE